MTLRDKICASTLYLMLLCSCKSGYNVVFEQPVEEDEIAEIPCSEDISPINSSATQKTKNTLNLFADLSCSKKTKDGFIVGQNLGYGADIVNDEVGESYERLIQGLTDNTPALISIDFEFDQQASRTELIERANNQLIDHSNAEGLVMISWSPFNPWTIDVDDTDDENKIDRLAHSNDVDLSKLINTNEPENAPWVERLDEVAAALEVLESNNVIVLFRPFPEMNSNANWWGTKAAPATSTANHEDFIELWKHTVNHLNEKLDNILWVYSPLSNADINGKEKADWAYPGEDLVDIVAGVELNNNLDITDYAVLSSFGHPLGMAKYGPQPTSEKNVFDNQNYITTLKENYHNVGFWVSWHSENIDGDDTRFLAIIDQENAQTMMEETDALSLEKLVARELSVAN